MEMNNSVLFSNFAASNTRNMRLINTIAQRKGSLSISAFKYFFYLFFAKSAVPMLKAIVVSALYRSVFVVFSFGSNTKMFWIYAWRVIARMHNNFSFRYFCFIKKLIGKSMRSQSLSSGCNENPITIVITKPRPIPTSFSLIYPSFKNIVCGKCWKVAQSSLFIFFGVTIAAKLSPNYPIGFAQNATHFYSGVIAHRTS